jgi:hypothetical protein
VWPESTISIDYQDIEKHIDLKSKGWIVIKPQTIHTTSAGRLAVD